VETIEATGVNEFALELTGAREIAPGVRTLPVGLTFGEALTFDSWMALGERLAGVKGSLHWWIGDWLNFGEVRYGETYAQALGTTGFDYQTLRDDKYISGRFPLSRRRDDLSFAHHREVASLPEVQADAWLEAAHQRGLSAKQLREAIKIAREGEQETFADPDDKNVPSTRLPVPATAWTAALFDDVTDRVKTLNQLLYLLGATLRTVEPADYTGKELTRPADANVDLSLRVRLVARGGDYPVGMIEVSYDPAGK
jgi:hypothetical protein